MKEKPVAEEIIITAANKQRKTLANRRKNKKNSIQQETSDTMTGRKQSAVTSQRITRNVWSAALTSMLTQSSMEKIKVIKQRDLDRHHHRFSVSPGRSNLNTFISCKYSTKGYALCLSLCMN